MSKYTSETAYVYVIEDESGIVKIGRSTNPPRRFNYIQRCCGQCIIRRYLSPLCYNHKQIETALLIEFGNHLKQGEHVSKVSFETVCAALDKQPFQTELPTVPPQSLVPFYFQKHRIRVILDEYGNPWFVAKDICKALDIAWRGESTLASIPAEWRGVRKLRTTLENQHGSYGEVEKAVILINEPAVYKLAFRSHKKEADTFTNWVASDVLTSIRQKGYYSLYGEVNPTTQTLVNEIAQSTIEQITTALAPLTEKPVVVVRTHKNEVKQVQVSFRVKLSFTVKTV